MNVTVADIRALLTEMGAYAVGGELKPVTCPDCGSPVELTPVTVEDVIAPGHYIIGHDLPTRQRETLALACSGCEFIVDIREAVQS